MNADERLQAELGLTPRTLGLTQEAFNDRVKLWRKLADERTSATAPQKNAHLRVLALTAWITRLMGQNDKFRAEGDLTTERDNMARIAFLQQMRTAAEAEAGLTLPGEVGDPSLANPTPILEPWGIL